MPPGNVSNILFTDPVPTAAIGDRDNNYGRSEWQVGTIITIDSAMVALSLGLVGPPARWPNRRLFPERPFQLATVTAAKPILGDASSWSINNVCSFTPNELDTCTT